MTELSRERIDELIEEYKAKEKIALQEEWETMYDDRSALINYALVRYFEPRVVVEYGAFKGRATHDILQALIDNGKPYIFKSYELRTRSEAQQKIDKAFGDKAIKIGGDVMESDDLPKEIDYLFLDHDHDEILSKWSWENVVSRVRKGGIIQIHDVPLKGDYVIGKDGAFPETRQIVEMYQKGTLPFEKLYWAYEDCGSEGSWWVKK